MDTILIISASGKAWHISGPPFDISDAEARRETRLTLEHVFFELTGEDTVVTFSDEVL